MAKVMKKFGATAAQKKAMVQKARGNTKKTYTVTPVTPYVTAAERELMRQWKREGKSKSEIMKLTGRSKNAVNLQLQRIPEKVSGL